MAKNNGKGDSNNSPKRKKPKGCTELGRKFPNKGTKDTCPKSGHLCAFF